MTNTARVMAEGLVKKRRIRAGHKAIITKRLSEVKGILETVERETGEPDLVKLAQLKMALTEKLEVLKQLDNEILDLLESEEDITHEIEQSDTFNQRVYETLVRIDQKRREASPRVTPSTATPLDLEGRVTSRPTHSKARLPKLTIHSFDGTLTDWIPFWDSYKAAIHTNPDLSNVDKFTYLQSLVERSAKDAISGLSLTEANYDEAIAILERRFGNKQQIIGKHMEILLNAESVSSANQVAALRKLYDKIESNVRGLASLGVTLDSYVSLLSSVLIQKLPSELRLIIGRRVTDEWTLPSIMEVLGEELEARERTATPRNDRVSLAPVKGASKPTTAALLSSNRADTRVTCCYCQGEHTADSCQRVGSAKERKQLLRNSGRCFVCLRRGHVGRNCRSRVRCHSCGGKHHTTICDQAVSVADVQRPPSQPVTQTSKPNLRAEGTLNPAATPYKGPSTTCCHVNSDHTVLLQTARVTVFNPIDSDKQKEISVILDTGSQKSYITESVIGILGIRRKGRRVMSVMTFGSDEGKSQQCDVVEVGLKLKGGLNRKLSLLTTPLICEPMMSTPVEVCIANYEGLRSLDLADSSTNSTLIKPDLLIGLDYYWTFVLGELIQCSDGLVAQNTQFGWVLSGPMPDRHHLTHSTNLVTHVLRVDVAPMEYDRQLDKQLKRFWELESFGIVDRECTIHEQFSEVIKFSDGRYKVPLPWKDPSTLIPDNYQLSKKRLLSLLQRLRQCPGVLEPYDQIIREQVQLGIVQPVETDSDEITVKGRIHYLPHHAVVRHDKDTTKVRVVYDASAKSHGPSLNDCLHVGPKFNQRIFDILLRFRAQKIALVADIEKAFLMIAVNEEDRDVLRFL